MKFFSLIFISLIVGLGIFISSSSNVVLAAEECGDERGTFFGIPTWDRGLENCDTVGIEEGSTNNVAIIINNIIAILISVAGLIAIIFVIVGGFNFVLSSGNPEKANSARSTLINALIGLVIAIMARVVIEIIYNRLTK